MKRRIIEITVTGAALALVGLFLGTEFVAWKLGWARQLGNPIVVIHGKWPIYEPWALLRWWWWWGVDLVPAIKAGFIAVGLTVVVPIVLGLMAQLAKPHRHVFGKREWGTERDAKKAGLLSKAPGGTVLGMWPNKRPLTYTGDEHQLVSGAAGSGKAQPDHAMVLTPTGFRRIDTLKIGDAVTASDGTISSINGVYPQGKKDIYKITFEDGRTAESCLDHLWSVWTARKTCLPNRRKLIADGKPYCLSNAQWETHSLAEIIRWFSDAPSLARAASIPLVAPFSIELPQADLPIPPYVLGALLGDGHFIKSSNGTTSVKISVGNNDADYMLGAIEGGLPEYMCVRAKNNCDYHIQLRNRKKYNTGRIYSIPESARATFALPVISRKGVKDTVILTNGGLSLTVAQWADRLNTYPENIYARLRRGWGIAEALCMATRQRQKKYVSPLTKHLAALELIGKHSWEKFVPELYKRGSAAQRVALLQGLLDTDGSIGNGTHATFTSTSEQLAKDVQEIAWSLGAKAKIAERQTYFTYKGIKKPGRPSWRVSIVHPNISSMFSLPRKVADCTPKLMRHNLHIKAINYVGSMHARCISIEHPSGLYVTDNFIVTHNTSGPVVSTLLSWTGSTLIYDPKRELYAQTARHRSTLGPVFYFDPTDPKSVRFNPLLEVRVGTEHEAGDIQNLVSILVDPGDVKDSLEYWDTDASRLLTGLLLYAVHDLPVADRTLGKLNELLLKPQTTLPAMKASSNERCKIIGEYIAGLPEKQRAGVYASASATLLIFDDPVIATNTSTSQFRISDLVCSDRPVSCYIQVRPTDATRLRPLTRLLLTQVAQSLMYDIDRAADGRHKQHRLLYLLEEFPSLGRLNFFSSQMRMMRGYGITALLIVQSFKDIISAYGREQTIVDNCRIVVTFASSDPETQKMISTMVGTGIEHKLTESRPRGIHLFAGNVGSHEGRRPLLDPGEIGQLPYNEQLVIVSGEKRFRTKKIQWFKHRQFRRLGTNLALGEQGPAQGQVSEVTPPASEPAIRTLASAVELFKWSQREAADRLFPGISPDRARHWIRGTSPVPVEHARFVTQVISLAKDGVVPSAADIQQLRGGK